MSKKKERDDVVPAGVCTALKCTCDRFMPRTGSPMYCARVGCGHSVEHHHLNARDVK